MPLLSVIPASAEQDIIGSDQYRRSCMACHGPGGPPSAPKANEQMVRGRILDLVNYHAAIQQPSVGGPLLNGAAPQSAQRPPQ